MGEQFKNKYYLVFISTILGPLSTNALIPLFDVLKDNFLLSEISLVSLAISFYIFPFSILQLFAGTFSDIVDKKKVVIVGFIIFLFSLILTFISILIKNYPLFVTAFFFQGVGFAMINPTVLAILNIITPTKKKGFIMGLYNSSAGFGVSFGAFLSRFFANTLSNWILFFILNPIITFFALIFFIFATRNCDLRVCRTSELDANPNLLKEGESKLIATFRQLRENLNINIIILGVSGFFTFFSIITLTNTITEQVNISIPDLTMQDVISSVSLILMVNGFISIILSPIMGILLNKIHPLTMIIAGFFMMFAIIALPLGTSLLYYVIISAVIYIGSSMIWPALFHYSMELNQEASGTNSAIINSLRFLGYSMVGIFYVLMGIPLLYYLVLILNIIGVLLIHVLKQKLT